MLQCHTDVGVLICSQQFAFERTLVHLLLKHIDEFFLCLKDSKLTLGELKIDTYTHLASTVGHSLLKQQELTANRHQAAILNPKNKFKYVISK